MSIVCRSDYNGDELLGFSYCCFCGKSSVDDARNSRTSYDKNWWWWWTCVNRSSTESWYLIIGLVNDHHDDDALWLVVFCGGRFFHLESVRITILLSIGLHGGIKIIWENRLKSMDQMNILFCLVCHVSFSRNMADGAHKTEGENMYWITIILFYSNFIFFCVICR